MSLAAVLDAAYALFTERANDIDNARLVAVAALRASGHGVDDLPETARVALDRTLGLDDTDSTDEPGGDLVPIRSYGNLTELATRFGIAGAAS